MLRVRVRDVAGATSEQTATVGVTTPAQQTAQETLSFARNRSDSLIGSALQQQNFEAALVAVAAVSRLLQGSSGSVTPSTSAQDSALRKDLLSAVRTASRNMEATAQAVQQQAAAAAQVSEASALSDEVAKEAVDLVTALTTSARSKAADATAADGGALQDVVASVGAVVSNVLFATDVSGPASTAGTSSSSSSDTNKVEDIAHSRSLRGGGVDDWHHARGSDSDAAGPAARSRRLLLQALVTLQATGGDEGSDPYSQVANLSRSLSSAVRGASCLQSSGAIPG